MHTFTYENQGSDRFLIYQLGENEELDITALQMMNHNRIPNLLPVSFTQIDNQRYLRYSGLGQSTLKNLLSGVVKRDRLLKIFDSICETVLSSEEYFLDGNAFVLNEEYIYVDHSTDKTGLIYLPVINQDNRIDYSRFFKNIIINSITDPSENGNYVIRLLNFINAADNFSLSEFMKLIKELRRTETETQSVSEKLESVKKPRATESKKSEAQPERKRMPDSVPKAKPSMPQPQMQSDLKKAENAVQRKEVKRESPIQKREISGYGFEIPGMDKAKKPGQTVPVMKESKEEANEQKMSMIHLLRNFSGENLELYKKQHQKAGETEKKKSKEVETKKKKAVRKDEQLTLVSLNPMHPCRVTMKGKRLRIGRRAETNDIVFGDIKSVSRDHCEVVRENDMYYVVDRNSTYGTKVDGMELKKETGRMKSNALGNGSVIELKEISFRVEIQ